jgi:F-type H+-transporting ATPase subunit b
MRSPLKTRWCRLFVAAIVLGSVVGARAADPAAPPAEAVKAEHGAAAEHGEVGELAHGNASEKLEDAAEFKTDLAIYTFVVFLLLLAILGKFAWPPITKALEERERAITDNIAAAEARHEDAKRLLAEHEAKLAAAAGEVRALLEEARRDAEVTRKRIEAEGQKAAQDEVARAKREIERARDSAVQDLAVASANVAIDLAKKIIHEQLTPEKNNQIIRDAVAKFVATPSKN